MKTLLVLIFTILGQFICIGQINIEWEKVSSPDSSYRLFQYISKSGALIYKDKHENLYYISSDFGESWEKIKFPKNSYIPFGNADYQYFREDEENNIYFLGQELMQNTYSNCIIYKLDLALNKISLFYNHGFNNSIRDFNFLPNSDLIISTDKKLSILNTFNFQVKYQKNITTNKGHIFLSNGFSSYVNVGTASSNSFQKFDDTLGFIGNKFNFPFYNGLKYSRGRFFNDGNYSDNAGQTWQQLVGFPFFDNSRLYIGHNGYLFTVQGDNYIYSKDNGDSKIVLGENNRTNVTTDKKGNFISFNYLCNSKNNRLERISFDEGKHWKEFRPNRESKPFALSVVAGVDGSLIAGNQCQTKLCYINKENRWDEGKNLFGKEFDSDDILALPDGRYLLNDFTTNYIVNKDFDSLQNCNYFYFPTNSQIYLKNNKIYFIEGGKLTVSEDYLNIQTTKSFYAQNVSQNIPTSQNKIIQRTNVGWRILNLTNNLSRSMMLDDNINVLESSYNGPNIYAAHITERTENDEAALVFNYSIDEGMTFYSDTLISNVKAGFIRKMMVDHYENIYILVGNNILASFNEGNSWIDITPKDSNLSGITDISVSHDNFIYLSTLGLGILRSNLPNTEKTRYIKVKGVKDEDLDCIKGLSEVTPVYGKVKSGIGYIRPLDINGETYIYYPKDSTDISLIVNTKLMEVCQDHYQIQDFTPDDSITFNVKVFKECADLQVGLSTFLLRRCFENQYSGFIKNDGNEKLVDGKVHITLDKYFNFISSNLAVISYNHPDLILKVPNLGPNENANFHIKFELDCSAALGEEHCISAFTEAKNDCNIDSSSIYIECRENIGSYDPNDKSIFVSGLKNSDYETKDDKIEYLIRFQNTGTDTAFNVRIEDKISQFFDINSIKPTVASHDFDWEIKPDRILVVYFNNIQLVDSFTNEEGSNGFVKFEIKMANNMKLGDTLVNEAFIFFDYNDPIVTNKVKTVYNSLNKVQDFNRRKKITAMPNPTTGIFKITCDINNNEPCIINIFNLEGELIFSKKSSTSTLNLNIETLPPSIYIVQVLTKDNKYTTKVIKM
jgi:uncharacterized repeat protein (TIGR01451 family)